MIGNSCGYNLASLAGSLAALFYTDTRYIIGGKMTIVFESIHSSDLRPAVDKAGNPVRSPYEGVGVYTVDAAAVEARALKLLKESINPPEAIRFKHENEQ